jgi:glycosyltransferase involved in cell wall biosynthesis
MQNKLRVLVVPDYFSWVLGTWAKQIARVGTTHDYYFFSQQMLPHYPDEWNYLISKVDVIHFLNHWYVKDILVPEDLARINTVTHVASREEWEEQILPLTQADAVVVIAEEWKQFLNEKGITSKYIHLFHVGVDTGKFHKFKNKLSARKQLGIYSDLKLIGYSAKFSSDYRGRKGVDVFLKALQILSKKGCEFGVVITGPGWNEAVHIIENYGIEVHYRPFLPDRFMPALYNSLDLYVCTARVEGGPVPVIESMACGTPVVVTPVGIVNDFLKDNTNALIVPKDDAHAVAHAIVRLLTSPELRSQLANSALQTVEKHLTWHHTLTGIEQLYTKVWQTKTGNSHRVDSSDIINPVNQRNWAINVDSYLWHYQLYQQQYRLEGLRGMVEGSLGVRGKDTLKLIGKTFDTLNKDFIRKIIEKRL